MNISLRLKTIAGMVRFYTLADVGTDHALLPVYLYQTGLISSAAACDVNKGPLERAKETIAQNGLGGIIETRLGSGLEPLDIGEFETLVIAGMGGTLITQLLFARLETAKSFKQILLQPQRNFYDLRMFLLSNGFSIINEELLIDSGIFYFIIEAEPGKSETYNESEVTFGKFVPYKNHDIFQQYIASEINKLEHVAFKDETKHYLELCRANLK